MVWTENEKNMSHLDLTITWLILSNGCGISALVCDAVAI